MKDILKYLGRLKDLDDNPIDQDDEHGEMYIKGPCMMSGYLDNPTATAAAIDEDGWLRTGDIAYVNKGKVYIIDRAKVSLLSYPLVQEKRKEASTELHYPR